MNRILALCLPVVLASALTVASRAQIADPAVFINEFHYDNSGVDAGEFVEIAGPAGTDLTGYSIVLYNGADGLSYDTDALTGLIPNQQNGFGTVSLAYPSNGLQNGSPDGIALVQGATVIQFLSYEGAFTALNGPASGIASTDIGISEPGTLVGTSLRLTGTGDSYADFVWAVTSPASPGAVNAGQTFVSGPTTPVLSINDSSVLEGDDGDTPNTTFTVSLTSAAGPGGVSFMIDTADGSASAGIDYQAVSTLGTIPEGSSNHSFSVPIIGDSIDEPHETFVVEISQITGADPGDVTGTGTITDDDEIATPPANVVINELDSDTPGTDAAEFVELYDGGAGHTSLSGLVLVFYNGSNDLSYFAVDLDGFSTDASGYFTVGNAGVSGLDAIFAGNLLQNGADAVALYAGSATDFPTNTPITTANLLDAVVYDTSDADDAQLLVLLNAGQPQVDENGGGDGTIHSIQRCPNGAGGSRNTSGLTALLPTPDGDNGGCPAPPPPPVARSIGEIQGAGDTSPLVNTDAITTGVVTGRKVNGFFLQSLEPDSESDTSEGLFVFTNSTPMIDDAGVMRLVALGDVIEVTGRIVEFRRSADARPETLTELSAPLTLSLVREGEPLPAALDTAAIFTTGAGSRAQQLERYESMLLAAGDLRVVAPTNGFGEFFAVVDGVARPFREPGILIGDPLPADAPVPNDIPIFDGNFERLMVEADEQIDGAGLRRTPLHVGTGATVTGVFGPLDYAFDEYRIQVDASAVLSATGGYQAAVPVPVAAGNEFTIGSANLLNFINPSPDRVAKAALMVTNVLRSPAVLGVIEVGDVAALQRLVDAVNAAAGTSYEPHLLDANEASSTEQNIGFLVDAARVSIAEDPVQLFKGKTFEFAGVTDILHDRPPLVLEVNVQRAGSSQTFPVTIMLLHLKSLIEVDSSAPFGSGQTLGARNREKRRLGAEDVADAIEALQGENLVVLGDLNAFEFNDGYVDVVGTLQGAPAASDEVVESSVDRWDHELVNLVNVIPDADQRYSYSFSGSAQVLDHILVNGAMAPRVSRLLYMRGNADLPAALATDFSRPERASDHDAPVAYFTFPALADLSIGITAPPSGQTGAALSYSLSVVNAGPDAASDVTLSVPAVVTLGSVAVTVPDGWSCSSSGMGALSCAIGSLAAGATATFAVEAIIACTAADGTLLSQDVLVAGSTPESTLDNNASSYSATALNPPPTIQGVVTPIVVAPVPGAASPGAVVADQLFGLPSVTDNCAGTVLTRSGVPPDNLFPVGTSIVTYTAVDAGGATATSLASVLVLTALESLLAIEAEVRALIAAHPPASPQARRLGSALRFLGRAIEQLNGTPTKKQKVKAANHIVSALEAFEEIRRRNLLAVATIESLLKRTTGVNWLMAKQDGGAENLVEFGDILAAQGLYSTAARFYATAILLQ